VNAISESHVYNLKATVEHTGVSDHTLRAWERRYGLPKPERSDAGHRLYSQNDLLIIRWLAQQVAQGMAVSRAVDLHDQLQDTGQAPWRSQEASESPVMRSDGNMQNLREEWVSAIRAFDEQSAEQVVSRAFGLFDPESVATGLLQQGMSEIGDL